MCFPTKCDNRVFKECMRACCTSGSPDCTDLYTSVVTCSQPPFQAAGHSRRLSESKPPVEGLPEAGATAHTLPPGQGWPTLHLVVLCASVIAASLVVLFMSGVGASKDAVAPQVGAPPNDRDGFEPTPC